MKNSHPTTQVGRTGPAISQLSQLGQLTPLTPRLASPDSVQPRPRLRTIMRRVGVSLLIACVIPGSVFYVCFSLGGIWTAIIAALAWSYGALAYRALTGRRTSGLLVITALLMTARTVLALATGSTFLYFLQPVFADAAVGATFLFSLFTVRPLVARLAGDFYPMDEELSTRPRVRRLFWHLTLVWALLCLAKGTLTLWLLQSTSLHTFVVVKSISVPTINTLAAASTILAAVLVARKEGLLGPGELRGAWATG